MPPLASRRSDAADRVFAQASINEIYND